MYKVITGAKMMDNIFGQESMPVALRRQMATSCFGDARNCVECIINVHEALT